MAVPRKLAGGLLRAVIRLAPPECQEWAIAMLREVDFIDGEWAALFWALGSATAILRQAIIVWQAWLQQRINQEGKMNTAGKRILGVALGMFSALALVGCGFATLRLVGLVFPGLEHSPWAYWLAIMAIPEAVFVAATILLWRKRGPIAAGILATALVMALHVAVHLTLHW